MAANVQVLLRRSVEAVGRVGEVVRVKPGFARNYLFPYGIGVLPTKENLRLVEKDKVAEAAEEAEKAKLRAEMLVRLAAASVRIEVKSNPEGHLFGSVGPAQVAQGLAAQGFAVEEKHVRMEPVKQLGEFDVVIHLAADAETKIKLWVLDEVTKKSSKADPEAEKAAAHKEAAERAEAARPARPAKAEKPAKADKPAKGEKNASK
jgi:large subunit ribosomal protein L9